MSEIRPKTSHVLEKNSNVFGKISHVFQETSDVFFALARRDKKEAALLVFHTKETRKQSSESTNLKTISPRAHAYAHNSNFRVFAFTTFTEILATLYVSIIIRKTKSCIEGKRKVACLKTKRILKISTPYDITMPLCCHYNGIGALL